MRLSLTLECLLYLAEVASLYKRKNSAFWYIRYRSVDGWRDKSLKLRTESRVETSRARAIVRAQSLKEYDRNIPGVELGWKWVPRWLEEKWSGSTLHVYWNQYAHLEHYFRESSIPAPVNLTREQVLGYISWRKVHGGSKNTALLELGLLRQLLNEAALRSLVDTNVAQKLGIPHGIRKEKSPWTDLELSSVRIALEKDELFSWKHVTFLFGLYQACRLAQCSIPLGNISFERNTITYEASGVKGGRAFTHRIDPSFLETLKELCEWREHLYQVRAEPRLTCVIPELPSLRWRKFLDSLGWHHLSHHGLRVTWITRAALAGIPENIAMRFVNHASKSIHRIYQKITVDDQAPFLDRLKLPQAAPGRDSGANPGSDIL